MAMARVMRDRFTGPGLDPCGLSALPLLAVNQTDGGNMDGARFVAPLGLLGMAAIGLTAAHETHADLDTLEQGLQSVIAIVIADASPLIALARVNVPMPPKPFGLRNPTAASSRSPCVRRCSCAHLACSWKHRPPP